MADLEGNGRTIPMLCSTLTMAMSTVAAALLIAVVPAVSGASYIQPEFAPQMALITAATSKAGLPELITIGMARICYKSPGVTCLPWSPGLHIDPVSFADAEKWQRVLPAELLTQIWAGLSIIACLLTFAVAFTSFCKGAPAAARWGFLLLAVLANGSYFVISGVLFFLLRERIQSGTEYSSNAVVITSIVYIVPLSMLILIPIITFFLPQSEYGATAAAAPIIINAKNPRLEELMLKMEAMIHRLDPNAAGKTGEDGTEKVGVDGLTTSRRKKLGAKVLARLHRQLAKLSKETPELHARRLKHVKESAQASDTVREDTVIRQMEEMSKLRGLGYGITVEQAKAQIRKRKKQAQAEAVPAQRQNAPDPSAQQQQQQEKGGPAVPPKSIWPFKEKDVLVLPPYEQPWPRPNLPLPPNPDGTEPPRPTPQPQLAASGPAKVKVNRFQQAARKVAAGQTKQQPRNNFANVVTAAASANAPTPPNPHDEVTDATAPAQAKPTLPPRQASPMPDPAAFLPASAARKPALPQRSQTTPMPPAPSIPQRPIPTKAPTAVYPARNDLMPMPGALQPPVQAHSPSPAGIPLPNSSPDSRAPSPAPKQPIRQATAPVVQPTPPQPPGSTANTATDAKKHESVAMEWK